jgi:hypothetical protein
VGRERNFLLSLKSFFYLLGKNGSILKEFNKVLFQGKNKSEAAK